MKVDRILTQCDSPTQSLGVELGVIIAEPGSFAGQPTSTFYISFLFVVRFFLEEKEREDSKEGRKDGRRKEVHQISGIHEVHEVNQVNDVHQVNEADQAIQ